MIQRWGLAATRGVMDMECRARRYLETEALGARERRWRVARGMVVVDLRSRGGNRK